MLQICVVSIEYIYCNTVVSSNYLDLAVTPGDSGQSKVAWTGLDSRLQTARPGARFRDCLRADPPFASRFDQTSRKACGSIPRVSQFFFALSAVGHLGNWTGVGLVLGWC